MQSRASEMSELYTCFVSNHTSYTSWIMISIPRSPALSLPPSLPLPPSLFFFLFFFLLFFFFFFFFFFFSLLMFCALSLSLSLSPSLFLWGKGNVPRAAARPGPASGRRVLYALSLALSFFLSLGHGGNPPRATARPQFRLLGLLPHLQPCWPLPSELGPCRPPARTPRAPGDTPVQRSAQTVPNPQPSAPNLQTSPLEVVTA